MTGHPHRRVRRNLTLVVGSVAAVAGIAAYATQVAAHDAGTGAGDDRSTGVYALSDEEIAAIEATIEPFADPAAAEAAGRVNLDLCFDMMGDHYADPATFGDGILDAANPEALVYADVDGAQQLVAVEWVSTAPGEVLGIPLHLNHDLDVWVLHAWVGSGQPLRHARRPQPRRRRLPGLTGPRSGRPAHHSAVWAAAASGSDAVQLTGIRYVRVLVGCVLARSRS